MVTPLRIVIWSCSLKRRRIGPFADSADAVDKCEGVAGVGELLVVRCVLFCGLGIDGQGAVRFDEGSMRRITFLLASVFCVIASGASLSAQDGSRTWISDVTIISPENLDRISTGSVLIEGGKIVRVERKAGL